MDMTLAKWRLGDLAMHYPGATAVLFKHHLDFCQASQTTLADAAVANQLDVEALVSKLSTHHLNLEHIDGSDYLGGERIAQLLHRYHQRHRQRFPELIRLAERVELDNGNHLACPKGLALLLMDMQFSMEMHRQKTQHVLMSNSLSEASRSAMAPLSRVCEQAKAQLQQLEQITHQFTAPRDASITWRALYNNLQWLKRDLQQHLQLEKESLFARVEQV